MDIKLEKPYFNTKNFEGGTRIIHFIGDKKRAYIWIGCKDGACFATVSDKRSLRKLAKAILAEVGE